MILTSGQLYFINEQDVKTGARSNYYKIGIVRDATGRNSKDRLLEHQTGNPRKLCIVETLNMPAVEAIETNLHALFARNRIFGEWMQFTESELENAISKAKELAVEMEVNIKNYETAEILKNSISNGEKLVSNNIFENCYKEILNFKGISDICDEIIKQYKIYIQGEIKKGVDVSGRATLQQRVGNKKFDEKLFESQFPNIWKEYLITSYPITGSFRIVPVKDWDTDLSSLNQDQIDLLSSFKEEIKASDNSLDSGLSLHAKYLGVLEISSYVKWREDIANTNLRVMTGGHEGIEGICTWKREEKEVKKLDKEKLKSEYPIEYESCEIDGSEVNALIVSPTVASTQRN